MATARTLDQIIAELNPVYNPQRESIQTQQNLIPGQIAAQESAVTAQKDKAYQDILSGARRRGTGVAFGGIPLSEQAQYNATTFAPAMANLKTAGINQAISLQDALNQINERQQTAAQNIYQTEQDRAATAAANQSNVSAYLQSLRQGSAAATTPSTSTTPLPMQSGNALAIRKSAGNYSFVDSRTNTPITAYQYAQRTGQDIGDLLWEMGNDGDVNAQKIYNILKDNPADKALPKALQVMYPWIMGTGESTPQTTTQVAQPNAPTNSPIRPITTGYGQNLWTPGRAF